MNTASNRVERTDPEVSKRSKQAALWSAVWEASQHLSSEEILEFVKGTLREIDDDQP